jgi:hypothetical protein
MTCADFEGKQLVMNIAYAYLCSAHAESPGPERIHRLLRPAAPQRGDRLVMEAGHNFCQPHARLWMQ